MLAPRWVVLPAVVPVLLVAAGCSGSTHPPTAATTIPTPAAATTTVASSTGPGTASTTIAIQSSGPRTVLSPIGLNIRSAPAKTATVTGTAAQGAVLTVIGHTDQGGGWYQVKGTTVTGYISDNPALSAEGKFTAYDSAAHNFTALYPETWAATEAPPASVVFHPQSGGDSIVVTTAATASALPHGHAGYRQDSDTVVVVCGVTGDLLLFEQTSAVPATSPGAATTSRGAATTSPGGATTSPGGAVAERYLTQIHLALDAQHALGVEGHLADLAQLPAVQNFLHSIAFPFPQCEGGASPQTASTAPASTVP